MKKDKIRGYLTAKTENSQVKVTYVGSSNLDNSEKQGINNIVGKYQQILNIRQSGINNKQLKTLTRKPSFKQKIQNSSHASSIKEISTMILIFVMYFILTTYASITAQEIASEKGSKIMEIIFSSMKAIRYFYGKILAVFCVIITHLAIYFVGGWIFFEVAARTKSLAPII
ncbi:MAG TPA: ABC transporter permease, partial [Lactobacillus acetotolerans]|nr:ABC transporter permease [Lactobacillus acetotolerans]